MNIRLFKNNLIYLFFIAFISCYSGIESKEKELKKETQYSKQYQRIEKTLKFGNSEQVRRAMDKIPALVEIEQKKLIPALEKLIQSNDILIRAKICTLVRKVKWNNLDEKIIPYLEEENRDIFFKALNAIESKKVQAALPVLEKKIKDSDFSQDDNKLQDMLRTAGKLNPKNLDEFLFEKLEEEKTLIANKNIILVYFSDTDYKNEGYIKYLKKYFDENDEPDSHKRYVVYAMGKTKNKSFIKSLKDELKTINNIDDIDERKKYRRLKMQIISALIELGDNNVYHILESMARDDDESIRIRAIRKMGELKIKEAIELLEFKIKYDPSMQVINEAKKALEKIKKKDNPDSSSGESKKKQKKKKNSPEE